MMIIEPFESPTQIQRITRKGCEILGIETVPTSECDSLNLIGKISAALNEVPYPAGQVDAEMIKGQYLTAMGIVYAHLIAYACGWQFCEIRKENERRGDAVNAVVSPDRCHFVFPIGVVYKEAHCHDDECRKVYEKIKTGNLPDVPAGSFFEVTA